MLAATNAASLLPPPSLPLPLCLCLSLVLDGAQVCLPMVAIHYHAGDIFVLASESSCQQKPIIVILSLKCCHCQCHSHSQCLLGLASQNVLSLARLLRLLFIDFKCNKRHCAAASIICTPSECWMQFNWTMLFGFVIVSIEFPSPSPLHFIACLAGAARSLCMHSGCLKFDTLVDTLII